MFDPITASVFHLRSRWSSRQSSAGFTISATKTPLMFHIHPTLPKRKPDRLPSIMNFRVFHVELRGIYLTKTYKNPWFRRFLSSPKWVTIDFLQPKKPAASGRQDGVFFFFFGQTAHAPEKRQQKCSQQTKKAVMWEVPVALLVSKGGLIV